MPAIEPIAIPQPTSTTASRIVSVDIFRGLTMAVMIFVNDLSEGVKGLPAWTRHAPAHLDYMTYVDMVFPAFLFAMGLSMPLAIRTRLSRGESLPSLWWHIILRSVSLMVLGLILANAELANSSLMPLHLAKNVWALLALFGAALFLNVYPKGTRSFWPKVAGLLLVIAMLAVFRRSGGHGAALWLDFSYWEILGIIGWTYLATCILYVPARRSRLAPVLWLAAMCLFNMLSAAHLLQFPNVLPLYVWPWSNGAFVILTLAGIVTSDILLKGAWLTARRSNMQLAAAFGVLLLVIGIAAKPLGISKIRATPTWCIVSAGASVLLFVFLYWICDVERRTRWSAFLRPAGANTLLTYLLPDFFFFGVSLAWLPAMWTYGLPGVFRSVVFTAFILLVAALLTRWRIRLQL